MKKIIIASLFIFLCFIAACTDDDDDDDDDDDIVEVIDFTDYESLFEGNWNRPGLYEKNGTPHVMPEEVAKTGLTIDVTHYGAIANDETKDNYSAFKDAIESAQAGDEVYVPEGTYYFKSYMNSGPYSAHIALKSGIIFTGDGADKTVLVSCFSENANQIRETTVITVVDAQDVLIKDLTVSSLTPDSKLPDPNNSGAQSNVFTGPKNAIAIETNRTINSSDDQTKNIVVRDCTIEKFQRMGVRIKQAREVTVKRTTFQKAINLGGGGAGYGVDIQGSGYNIDWTDKAKDTYWNLVTECDFVGPYLRHGALIQYYAHNNAILNNRFEGVLLDAIDMHGEDEYSNEIAFNTIINTRAGAGVGVGNSGATHDASGRNNFIHDNIIDGGRRGIDVILGSPRTIILNNVIKNLTQDRSIGITISDAPYTYVIGNTFENIKSSTDGYGIKINYYYDALDPSRAIPNNLSIVNNAFKDVSRGVYVETHGDNFLYEGNSFTGATQYEFKTDKETFVLPEKSSLMDEVTGFTVIASDANFITTDDKNNPQSQKNMKLKSSIAEPQLNRMIYAKFDVTDKPAAYQKVYLSFTAKAQDGMPVLNFWASETYIDWIGAQITWNNSRLHDDAIARVKVDETTDSATMIYEFKFPVAVYDFNTYYIDITDYVVTQLQGNVFTLIIADDGIGEVYMEVYNHLQVASNQHLRLIFQ